MIDVLVPVLGRPRNVTPLVESFRETSSPMDEIHFLCSPGDDAQIEACLQSGQHTLIVEWEAGPADWPRKINYGFRMTERPYLLLGADDLTFTPGWREALMDCAGSYGVIGTNDMASRQVMNGRSSTHPLVRRSYIETHGGSYDGPGTVIHEGYDHNFSERELIDLAKRRRQWVFCREAIIAHRHPLWGTTEWDPTYRKAMTNYEPDARLFRDRRHRFAGVR